MQYEAFLVCCIAIFVLIFNIFVYLKNKTSQINKTYVIFGICIFIWLFCFGIAHGTGNLDKKLFYYRIGYIGVIFIPVAAYMFISYLLEHNRNKTFIKISWAIAVFFLVTHFTKYPLVVGLHKYAWGYYPNTVTPINIIFLIFFLLLFGYTNLILAIYLIRRRNERASLKYMRIRYVFAGAAVGSLAGLDFLASYGINYRPLGFLFMFLYIIIFSYAVLKHRLMDVTIAITRTGIFIAVYSIVLGIPFAIAFGWREKLIELLGFNWWMVPLVTSTVLATVGPFVYLYIQNKAEDKIFQEQRRYQATLRQASIGMGRVKDLHRLVNLIVHIVTRTVRLEHSLIYLYDKDSEKFVLSAFRSHKVRFQPQWHIGEDAAIVSYLKEAKDPVVYEEIKQRTKDYGDLKLARLENELRDLNAALALPSFVDDKLLAIIILGEKVSKELYSQGDLAVFSILANQAALAIENAQFYVDMKRTHEQLFKAEKMATIGTMADGLSHQINNRLHALGFIAGDVLDTIKLKRELFKTPELSEIAVDIEHALKRIEDNVSKGGEIVRGLMKYTRKNEDGVAAVELDQLVTAALDMTQFKVKPGEMTVIREYGALPKIRGNFTQLQEVFFNLIDNAYDAMMQRKADLKEPGYKAVVRISAENSHNGKLNVFVEDNGIGIKDDDKHKLFTPFFTTKLSSKKGTGLGLYVIQKLIEENHGGAVHYASRYKEGTKVHLSLPIAADVKSKEGIKNA